MVMQAQDTFVAVLGDGTERRVTKGEPFAESHELVQRDAQASRDNPDRLPLFARLDVDEPESARRTRRGRSDG